MKTIYRKYQCLLPRTTLTSTVVSHVTYTAHEDAGSLVVRVRMRERGLQPLAFILLVFTATQTLREGGHSPTLRSVPESGHRIFGSLRVTWPVAAR